MNKADLLKNVSTKAGVSQAQASAVIKAFEETVVEELKNDGKIQLLGFGTFEVGQRAARTSRNLVTGENIEVPACKSPKFKFSKSVKDSFK